MSQVQTSPRSVRRERGREISRKACRLIVLLLFSAYPSIRSASLEITTPSSLPDGVKGEPYNVPIEVDEAVGELLWSVVSGEKEYVEVETPHEMIDLSGSMKIMPSRGEREQKMNLPFVFSYYGRRYPKMWISENGNVGPVGAATYYSNMNSFRAMFLIAPCWTRPGNSGFRSVYLESVPWRFVVTWEGRRWGYQGSSRVQLVEDTFQGVLYPSGEIEFNYGEVKNDLRPVIGISGGDHQHYVISVKNKSRVLNCVPSSRFMLSALPSGLEFDVNLGRISGTPTEFGLFGFRVEVDDLETEDPPVSKVFSIAVPGLFIHSRSCGVFIRRGEKNPISWGGAGIGDRVTVKLYRGGKLLKTILDSATNEEGVMWQPSDKYELSNDYSVVVEDNDDPPLRDEKPLTIWDNEVLVPQCCETIQEGIDFAREGDTVVISPGTYSENVLVKKKITLAGAEGGEAVLNGGGNGPVIVLMDADGATLRDLTVTNAAGEAHGGIYGVNSTVSMEGCLIRENSAVFGGGAYLDQCVVLLRNCRIEDNTAEDGGGGLYLWQCRARIDRCTITGNSAEEGGGLFIWYSAPRIVRTVIANNTAMVGAGIVCDEAFPTIANCTIADNASAETWSGAIHCIEDVPTLSVPWILNSIIWGNWKGVSGAAWIEIESSDTVDAPYAGTNGNIHENPVFVAPAEGNYDLAPDSPCINAGSPHPKHNDEDGTRCDMGAFGGNGHVPEQSVLTHCMMELAKDILIYWLGGSVKGL